MEILKKWKKELKEQKQYRMNLINEYSRTGNEKIKDDVKIVESKIKLIEEFIRDLSEVKNNERKI